MKKNSLPVVRQPVIIEHIENLSEWKFSSYGICYTYVCITCYWSFGLFTKSKVIEHLIISVTQLLIITSELHEHVQLLEKATKSSIE